MRKLLIADALAPLLINVAAPLGNTSQISLFTFNSPSAAV